ncbi:MAG TPA: rRNA maturation RNase YbeY [Thermoanaerobaculia bacterium]|nr:rRNA maturation RNase YbeY [Thermoanaerobaculia bacterium]
MSDSRATRNTLEVQATVRGAPPEPDVRRWLSRLLHREGARNAPVSVLLCGDARMRRLNREWRNLDRPTDVLSFSPAPDPPRPPRRLRPGEALGEIVIDVPCAARQARRRGHPVAREVQILLAHGLLHLEGFDHERDRGEMFRRQARLVRAAFGPGPDGVPREEEP